MVNYGTKAPLSGVNAYTIIGGNNMAKCEYCGKIKFEDAVCGVCGGPVSRDGKYIHCYNCKKDVDRSGICDGYCGKSFGIVGRIISGLIIGFVLGGIVGLISKNIIIAIIVGLIVGVLIACWLPDKKKYTPDGEKL
jgi:hypothetical protein